MRIPQTRRELEEWIASVEERLAKIESKSPRKPANCPSSLEECRSYFLELGLPDEAESFFDHFTANGWRQGRGGHLLRDWRAAARNWKRRLPEFKKSAPAKELPRHPVRGVHYELRMVGNVAVEFVPGTDVRFDRENWRPDGFQV